MCINKCVKCQLIGQLFFKESRKYSFLTIYTKIGTKKMNNLNKVNNNKGFSLVELIFVIVILALLIGVTIGSIYRSDNQSRVTMDIDNASSIQSIIAPVDTDAKVNKSLDKEQKVTIT